MQFHFLAFSKKIAPIIVITENHYLRNSIYEAKNSMQYNAQKAVLLAGNNRVGCRLLI